MKKYCNYVKTFNKKKNFWVEITMKVVREPSLWEKNDANIRSKKILLKNIKIVDEVREMI